MGEGIFKNKNKDRISSPEQLDKYINVVSVNVIIAVGAIILVLLGLLIFTAFGELSTVIETYGVCDNGYITYYVNENQAQRLEAAKGIVIKKKEYELGSKSDIPSEAYKVMDSYTLHAANFKSEDWVYVLKTETDLKDGVYPVTILTDSFKPISFLTD